MAEIRKVAPNWSHPVMFRNGNMEFVPLLGLSFSQALRDWEEESKEWDEGTHEYLVNEHVSKSDYPTFEDYESKPKRERHMPEWSPEEATWIQVYETVSEGTPITPAFATREELIDYLVKHGDYRQQFSRSCQMRPGYLQEDVGTWERDEAESFVSRELDV